MLATPGEILVSYVNVPDTEVRAIFEEVLASFQPLHKQVIVLRKRRIRLSTMRARPILNRHFFSKNKRQYTVEYSKYTKMDPSMRTRDLPPDVLRGWFAHELGHIMDYLDRSWIKLLQWGVNYAISRHARMGMEKMADLHALKFGFTKEIITTKQYILEHTHLASKYRKQIGKYYLSPEEIERMANERSLFDK